LVVFAALAAPHPGASAGETPIPAQKTLLGDRSAGSRAQPVHVIPLKDPEGDTIQPEDRRLLPFSTVQTCGADCHNAPLISRGWHFNAALPGALAGRKGQPWIWVDLSTATQLPLSYRSWPGTYKPSDLGIGAREFAVRFGGRTPGGLTADGADSQAGRARWKVSGDLEVNCLVCHDASPAYDQAEYAHQVALENFRYAPTAASGIAVIAGSAKQMSGLFDYLLPGSVEDALQTDVPAVHYAANRFMPGEKVAFDILREVKSARCYYCHTNADVQRTGEARWEAGEDVHVARGLACVACHRNGLDHSIVRGYEGEPAAARDAFAASLTCRGCHLHTAAGPHAGLGAPYPKHAGLPPVHLEKLTCTACHSGPWPDGGTHRMKNGLTHGLGEHNVNPALDALPHIYYPVFAQQEDGKLAPYRAIWPAFWGRLQAGRVAPLNPQEVKRVLEQAKLSRETAPDATWPKIDEAWVVQVLRLLDRNGAGPGAPVYITGGKLRRLGASGRLQIEDHPQAEPYLWPLGHDVRPASEALGAHGCEDCHSTTSAVLFGNVFVDSPLGGEPDWKMNRFEKKLDIAYQATLARSWVYRPWLKFAGVTAASMLLLLLLGYVLKGLLSLSARVAGVD
jgi:hypothetical protein